MHGAGTRVACIAALTTSLVGCSCGAHEVPPPVVPTPPTIVEAPPPGPAVGYTRFVIEGLPPNEGAGLAITEDALVVIGSNELVAVSGDGSARVVDNPEGYEGYYQRDMIAPVAAGAFLYFGSDDRLVARETTSLTTRFVFSLPHESMSVPRAFASGDRFVVRTQGAWIGIDARSGTEVWRAPLTPIEGSDAVLEGAAQGIVVEARSGVVRGLDANTGRELFRRASSFEEVGPIGPHGFGLRLLRDHASLVAPTHARELASQPRFVATIVGLDGRDRARIASEHFIVRDAMEVAERSTTLLVRDEHGVLVQTHAHDDGRVMWSAGPFAWGSGMPSFARGRDRAVLLSDPNTVRVLDLDGREVWRGQPDLVCVHVSLWSPPGMGEPWVVCRGVSNVTLYRPTAPAPRRSLHVSGTLTCDGDPLEEVVFVGGSRVETDATGHYEADIVVDDELMIGSLDRPNGSRCGPRWRRVEMPAGATSVTANLRLTRWMGGLDGL